MPCWLVKFSRSPLTKPLTLIVAPVRLPLLLTSATDSVESSVTAEPPPVNVTVPPAVTVGATCTSVSVVVPVFDTPLLVLPSLIVQSMVWLVVPPPPVGSPFDGLKLKVTLRSTAW